MEIAASEFRKTLFASLEKAIKGEPLTVVYKGVRLTISPSNAPSKLSRLKRQHAIIGDPDALIHSDPEFLAEMEAELEKDWKLI